ncbi:MAG: transglycosylase domain-containing protein [Deltaproteobacteria bacterium]|nr:transglycosylase domain-containing protein [Deltaproteobacteria bacterium]
MGRLKRMGAALKPPERTLLQRIVDALRRFLRWALALTVTALVSLGLALAGALGLFESDRLGAGAGAFTDAQIKAIIAQESPVLYRDGQTRIGVFFAEEHRQYVTFDELPPAWVDAIVAAEDQRFWHHAGVDPQGIARAMVQNVKAGRLVAGGSSLTQQTAKNLFYRPDRSLRSKLDELANAVRLERAFSKKKILEFYANQFHVSHNGRGIAIAARYFFNKEVGELDTLESAYIAGLVKAPANYNPFIGTTEERRAAARSRARARTGYVLDRMLSMGKLSHEEHARLKGLDIPFSRGVFRYDSSVLLDEVAARLEQAPFPEVFDRLGIDNPSTAGIQVVTTLDVDAQRAATYGLWHHLSEVGPQLEGQGPEALLRAAPPAGAEHSGALVPWQFYEGQIVGPAKGGLQADIHGQSCLIDGRALDRMATALARGRDGSTSRKATAADIAALKAALPAGSWTLLSLRAAGLCDLELRPALQGAVVVLEDGQIRAMVGGSDNQNFNRAVAAKRQLGSTWKPLLYYTALQLGWAPTDPLDNREAVFPFEGSWYSPRADHAPVATVSLNQAGVASENIASIWLLYHLLDGVEPEQLKELAEAVGLVPSAFADRDAWIRRVRDDFGVISTAGRVDELAFSAARLEMVRERGPTDPDRLDLMALLHGKGAVTEERRQARNGASAARLAALRWNLVEVEAAARDCRAAVEALQAEVGRSGGLGGVVDAIAGLVGGGSRPDPALRATLRWQPERGALACGEAGPGWVSVDDALLATWASIGAPSLPAAEDARLRGRLRLADVEDLLSRKRRWELVLAEQDPYDFEVLQHHPDFRVLLSMQVMSGAARAFGVQTPLPPVLSMPLGAVDISLEEAANIYQGMLAGRVWRFPGEVLPADSALGLWADVAPVESPSLLIAEIRDMNGAPLYRALPRAVAVAPPPAGRLLGDVLRNVVLHGTGRRAADAVTLGGQHVPVAGKTGTTNGFKNAAFAGFVPKAGAEGWTWGEGFTVVSYVGYDDNRPMKRGATRLAGASGALPAWITTAQGLADAGLLGKVSPGVAELRVEGGYAQVQVAAGSGAPTAGGPQRTLVRGAGLLSDGAVDLERSFEAAWLRGPAPAPASPPPPAPGEAEGPAPTPEEEPLPPEPAAEDEPAPVDADDGGPNEEGEADPPADGAGAGAAPLDEDDEPVRILPEGEAPPELDEG